MFQSDKKNKTKQLSQPRKSYLSEWRRWKSFIDKQKWNDPIRNGKGFL